MSFQDPISDCLTRIRNGLMRGKTHVKVPYSKLKHDLVDVLVSEGYLKSCSKTELDDKPVIEVELKYHNSEPVIKELKRIKTVAKYAGKRAALKAQMNDQSLSTEERYEARVKFQKLPRNASPSRVVRRCQVTGRPHAVYRKFGLSRIKLREAAMRGDIPGLVKSSW